MGRTKRCQKVTWRTRQIDRATERCIDVYAQLDSTEVFWNQFGNKWMVLLDPNTRNWYKYKNHKITTYNQTDIWTDGCADRNMGGHIILSLRGFVSVVCGRMRYTKLQTVWIMNKKQCGRQDRETERYTDRQWDGHMEEQMDGRTDIHTYIRTDRKTDGQTDGRMDGRMDRKSDVWKAIWARLDPTWSIMRSFNKPNA